MTIDQARRLQRFARWHRRLALFVIAWLSLLACSGVLINHSHDWGLDRAAMPASFQRLLYGLHTGTQDHCETTPTEGVDCRAVFARISLPAGALLLAEDSIYLLDETGRLVERLASGQLGLGRIEAGLRDGDRIYLRDNRVTVMTDTGLLDSEALQGSRRAALATGEWQERGPDNISWERLLLDLHAARFLGPLAGIFSDLMALSILLLAVTGSWLYRLRNRSNNRG
jgi:hypothetical protein